jgi:DNA (cytosine-5)-methyltransferase 1
VQWRELCAADFGVPTTRTRLFVVARCDDKPIAWPQPTHSRGGGLLERPWRGAAGIIDWSLPVPSIFSRARPLAEATLRRIALGMQRFVLGEAQPFIIPVTHSCASNRARAVDQPMPTITTAQRGEHALVAPFVATLRRHCTGSGHADPLGTITAGGEHHAVVAAFLARYNGGGVGHPARLCDADRAGAARVAAFLVRYNGQNIGQDVREPLGTATTIERFALVAATGLPIVDIGMRMLTWRELAAAQGFPAGYVLDRGADGAPLSKRDIVRLIGNSVCPALAEAVVRANLVAGTAERPGAVAA